MYGYLFPDYIDEFNSILPELINQKKQTQFDYLLQRLFKFYIRLSDVITSGDNFNRSLLYFVKYINNTNPKNEDIIDFSPYQNLKACIDIYRVFVNEATREISEINDFTRSIFIDEQKDASWKFLNLPNKYVHTNLLFNTDFMTVGEFRHRDDEIDVFGIPYKGIMFDYKIVDHKVEITEFDLSIPTDNDNPLYLFDEGIEIDTLRNENILELVNKFSSRRTLHTMKLTHPILKLTLKRYCSDSFCMSALDLKNKNHNNNPHKLPPSKT